ncbi:MAG TPA: hypothetical protein VHS78_13750 [Candidatus Elarobacter sp.]|nr:hypothetical protein [Candidatus Elarobacter sp.]
MRLVPVAAASVLSAASVLAASVAPAVAAPVPVLLVTDVGDAAHRTMPAAVWRRLATDYVGARSVTAEDGTALPDEARCRAAHAQFAVFATFDRAVRLPGLAQENDRLYGVARFTVRDCTAGTVSATKVVRIESEPLPQAAPGDADAVAERAWESAIRTTLAHAPPVLGAPASSAGIAASATVAPSSSPAATTADSRNARIARVVNVDGDNVYVTNTGEFSQNQVLRAYADAAGKPYAQPAELVVVELTKRFVIATIAGKSAPHVGDRVEALLSNAK